MRVRARNIIAWGPTVFLTSLFFPPCSLPPSTPPRSEKRVQHDERVAGSARRLLARTVRPCQRAVPLRELPRSGACLYGPNLSPICPHICPYLSPICPHICPYLCSYLSSYMPLYVLLSVSPPRSSHFSDFPSHQSMALTLPRNSLPPRTCLPVAPWFAIVVVGVARDGALAAGRGLQPRRPRLVAHRARRVFVPQTGKTSAPVARQPHADPPLTQHNSLHSMCLSDRGRVAVFDGLVGSPL